MQNSKHTPNAHVLTPLSVTNLLTEVKNSRLAPDGKNATDSIGAPWSTLARHRSWRMSHSLQM